MKRKLFFAAILASMVISFPSCEGANCRVCQQNTYDSNGDLIREGTETEYCDASLLRIQATPDVTVGGVTTRWECR